LDSNNKYTISFKSEDKTNSLPSLFYDDYGFLIVDGKVQKIKLDELNLDSLGTNANDYECEHLSFSKLTDDVLGEYQLEKGSIIWKIQITELDDEEFKRNIIKEEIEKPINDFIDQIINVKVNEEDPNKRIIVIEKLVQDLIKKMERTKIEELSKDFIKRIIQIEELDNGHHEWKFKIKELCKDFTKQMTKIEELAKDPDNLKIEIIEKKLMINKDLIQFICTEFEGVPCNNEIDI